MEEKALERRLKIVYTILSIPPYKKREIQDFLDENTKFASINIPFLSSRLLKQVKQHIDEKWSVTSTMASVEYNFPINLVILTEITRLKNPNPAALNFLGIYVLYSYITMLMKYEASGINETLPIVFQCLTKFTGLSYQNVIAGAVSDIFYIVISNFSIELFAAVFDSISTYFLVFPTIPQYHYGFLHQALQKLIQYDKYASDSFSARLSSLISMILINQGNNFRPADIQSMFSVIEQYLYQLNPLALILLQHLRKYLDTEVVYDFFKNISVSLPSVVETGKPFIVMPSPTSYYALDLVPSPASLNRFPENPFFANGLDVRKEPELPKPTINDLCIHEILGNIELIVKATGNDPDVVRTFLQSYQMLLQLKTDSEYYYDYLGVLAKFMTDYTLQQKLDYLAIPDALFDPAFSLFDKTLYDEDNHRKFTSIRSYAIAAVLRTEDSNFDLFLMNNAKYPRLLSEIFELLILNIENFTKFIHSHTRDIRIFRQISLQLQSLKPSEEVEMALQSLFRLFFYVFKYHGYLQLFFDDESFILYFFSLVFEINIRPFVLSQIKCYIAMPDEISPVFIMYLMQILDQIRITYPNDDGFRLISELLSTITKSMSNVEPFLPITESLRQLLAVLDNSDCARDILLEIIYFYVQAASNPKFNIANIIALEKPLRILDNIGEKEFHALVNLLAGQYLVEPNPSFDIKNPKALIVMFNVFKNHESINVVQFAKQLCVGSTTNCIQCHSCGFDIAMLEDLLINRETNNPRVQSIIECFPVICTVVSSPIVVQRFLSLFTPVEGRYVSDIHHLLLTPFQQILEKAQESPASSMSLTNPMNNPLFGGQASSIKNGITFIGWLYFENTLPTWIFSILENQTQFFVCSSNNSVLYINDQSTNVQIPRKRWSFFSLTIRDTFVSIYIDSHIVNQVPVTFPSQTTQYLTASIGSSKNQDGQISNFGVCQVLSQRQIENIYKLGPRSIQKPINFYFYYSAENMKTTSQFSMNKTFTDILLRFFKVEIVLPFFAQIDLPLKSGEPSHFSIKDVVSVLSSILLVGEMEQIDFCDSKGFSIVSHLLLSSSIKQISYDLYLKFFQLFESLLHDGLRKELFTQVLLNYEIWIVAEPDDLLHIIEHWNKNVFPTYYPFFLEFFSFAYLLNILRIYFWYKPIEELQIKGEPSSNRPRNSGIDVKACRLLMCKILFDISAIHFTSYDFSALMSHCITLVDDEQKLDLLYFMKSIAWADHLPLQTVPDRFETLSRIHYLLNNPNDNITCAVIDVIVAFHTNSKVESISLSEHLEIVFRQLAPRPVSWELYNGVFDILKRNTPQIFFMCSYMIHRLKSTKLYDDIQPSSDFISSVNWMIWSVISAVQQKKIDEEIKIFSFLCKCFPAEWIKIYGCIEICQQVYYLPNSYHQAIFLRTLCNIIVNTNDNIPVNYLTDVMKMLKFHIYIREVSPMSPSILTAFRESPFTIPIEFIQRKTMRMPKRTKSWSSLIGQCEEADQLADSILSDVEYFMKPRILPDRSWEDEDLAKMVLKICLKCRTNDFLHLALITASFLLKTQYDYVIQWLRELGMTIKEYETHVDAIGFLIYKASKFNKPFIYSKPPEEIYPSTQHVLEEELPELFDPQFAESFSEQHKTMKVHSNKCFSMATSIFSSDRNAAVDDCLSDIAGALENIRNVAEANSKKWQRLWSIYNVEGGPWDPSRITGKRVEVHWKRDKCCCKFLCPTRMKRNKKYTNHMKASLNRDSGNNTSAEQKYKEYTQKLLEEYKANAPPELLELPPIDEKETEQEEVKGRKLFESPCEWIRITGDKNGTFSIYPDSIHLSVDKKSKLIMFSDVDQILLRRRYHHPTAIEIFLQNGSSYLLNFTKYLASDIIARLPTKIPERITIQKVDIKDYFKTLPYTQLWANGKISNFEYLMKLNIYGGRSFNDPSQYPFFPWIIQDYESEVLDLTKDSSFRDLERPIGRIGEERFAELLQRMKDMHLFHQPKYLYSSFAICPLSLYLWLLRMEPFTSLHIEMQSGKFDHPTRLFSSIADSYKLVTTHLNDYRELVPEFYFLPEFLVNSNGLDLGHVREKTLGDVVLPPWSSNAIELVYIMRKAMESEYVNRKLNNWIDLFWGYKSKGEEAEKADNIYTPDLYEDSWDQKSMVNPMRRAEIEAAMAHVGTMPAQIFTEAHPLRNIMPAAPKIPSAVEVPLFANLKNIATGSIVKISNGEIHVSVGQRKTIGDFLVKFGEGIEVSLITAYKVPNMLTMIVQREIGDSLAVTEGGMLYKTFGGTKVGLFHKELANVSITSEEGGITAIVSDEATLNIYSTRLMYQIPFFGEAITCCAVSKGYGVIACGTVNGNVVVCSIYKGTKVNVIALDNMVPQRILITGSWGFIVTNAVRHEAGVSKEFIVVHNINGLHIRTVEISANITAWDSTTTRDGFDYIIAAADIQGKMFVFEAFYAKLTDPFYRCHDKVVATSFLSDESTAVSVTVSGKIIFHPYVIK